MRDIEGEMAQLLIKLGEVNEKIYQLKNDRKVLISLIVELLQEIGAFDE